MLIFNFSHQKLIVILYFELMSYDYMSSCRTITDLMLYNYTLPSRTTIGCHVVRHENLLTLLFNLKNHNSLIFSTFFSSFIFSIFTQNKNLLGNTEISARKI